MKFEQINLNRFARDVTLTENGVVHQNVAEIKETLRIVLTMLAGYRPSQVLELLERFKREAE